MIHSDSWMLLAIIYAADGKDAAALTDIIAAADFINHAIITRSELEIGLEHLIEGGFVKACESGYAPSEDVSSFWHKTGARHRTVLKGWDAIAGFLGAPPWAPGALPKTDAERFVTEDAYASALKAYLGRMRRRSKPNHRSKK